MLGKHDAIIWACVRNLSPLSLSSSKENGHCRCMFSLRMPDGLVASSGSVDPDGVVILYASMAYGKLIPSRRFLHLHSHAP